MTRPEDLPHELRRAEFRQPLPYVLVISTLGSIISLAGVMLASVPIA